MRSAESRQLSRYWRQVLVNAASRRLHWMLTSDVACERRRAMT
jgi:hypothetical protein